MEFLESLYSIENFGIYLFVVIGVLVVAFLVILFFGKKDEMKRKEEKKEEVVPDAFNETTKPIPLEVTEIPVTNNDVIEEPVVAPVMPSIDEVSSVPPVEKEFDFDALAEAISKELESIETNISEEVMPEPTVVEPVVVEPITFDRVTESLVEPVLSKAEEVPMNFQVFEPVKDDIFESPITIEEPKEEVPVEPVIFSKDLEPIIPSVEEPKKVSRPAVFSSVYVNRHVEEPRIMEEQRIVASPEPIVEEKIAPVIPKIELPKMMDLPKKK